MYEYDEYIYENEAGEQRVFFAETNNEGDTVIPDDSASSTAQKPSTPKDDVTVEEKDSVVDDTPAQSRAPKVSATASPAPKKTSTVSPPHTPDDEHMTVEEHDTHVEEEPEDKGSDVEERDSVVPDEPYHSVSAPGKIKTKTVVVGEPLKVTVGRAGEFPSDIDDIPDVQPHHKHKAGKRSAEIIEPNLETKQKHSTPWWIWFLVVIGLGVIVYQLIVLLVKQEEARE